MDTIATITADHLAQLSYERAREVVGKLLYVEAERIGVLSTDVHVPLNDTTRDGGIDPWIESTVAIANSEIIPTSITGYQVKTGDFRAWQPAKMRNELLDARGEIKSSVRRIVENGGTYIIVIFGNDLNAQDHPATIANISNVFADFGLPTDKIRAWGANTLKRLIEKIPPLAMAINGYGRSRFLIHEEWSQIEALRAQMYAGEQQLQNIATIQADLLNQTNALHIRVTGPAGRGKTKLVLEATRIPQIAPTVIYCRGPHAFIGTELEFELVRAGNDFTATVIVDDCNREAATRIVDQLSHKFPRLRLITIYNEYERSTGPVREIHLEELDETNIKSIIVGYGNDPNEADRFIKMCGGYPRVAHHIGFNLKNHPDQLLVERYNEVVWALFLASPTDNDTTKSQRRTTARIFSLFKRFGYGQHFPEETKVIAELIREADSNITTPRLNEIIDELKAREVLKGLESLYISPELLQIKLWGEWWDINEATFDYPAFIKKLAGAPQLQKWFFEMISYARESQPAQRVITRLFEKGILNEDLLKTDGGASFFRHLADANPSSALALLERTVGQWDIEQRRNLVGGRRYLLYSLEKMAFDAVLFERAAYVILLLAEAENEPYSNNATNIFAGLFSMAPGKVAPTSATPEQRFPILEATINSTNAVIRKLGLAACNVGLHNGQFMRMSGPEYAGLRKIAEPWAPKTYGELFVGYRRIWNLLRSKLDELPEEERQEAVKILLDQSDGLVIMGNLAPLIVDTLFELAQRADVDSRLVLVRVVELLHYRSKSIILEERARLEELQKRLEGEGFKARLHRYVGLNILPESLPGKGDSKSKLDIELEHLAAEAMQTPELLYAELLWLNSTEARNSFSFGYDLAVQDREFTFLPKMIEALRLVGDNWDTRFVGSYLRRVRELDSKLWERIVLTEFSEHPKKMIPANLVANSGLSDAVVLELFKKVKSGELSLSFLEIIERRDVRESVSEELVIEIVKHLSGYEDRYSLSVALDIFSTFYVGNSSRLLPLDLTRELLLNNGLLKPLPEGRRDYPLESYHWVEIAKEAISKLPDLIPEIGSFLIDHFRERKTIFEGYMSSTEEVIDILCEQSPSLIWHFIEPHLSDQSARAFDLERFLQGDSFDREVGALTKFPMSLVFNWVNQDPESRAIRLAHFVPKKLSRDPSSFAHELLVRYGDIDSVRSEFMSNYWSGGWAGSIVHHYQAMLDTLLKFREQETNRNVIRWIDEMAASLTASIESEKIREERREY